MPLFSATFWTRCSLQFVLLELEDDIQSTDGNRDSNLLVASSSPYSSFAHDARQRNLLQCLAAADKQSHQNSSQAGSVPCTGSSLVHSVQIIMPINSPLFCVRATCQNIKYHAFFTCFLLSTCIVEFQMRICSFGMCPRLIIRPAIVHEWLSSLSQALQQELCHICPTDMPSQIHE